jgi:DNA-binding CsgD family transcriptional regulator
VARSQRLTINDIRAVFRLLGEVRELGASPLLWRRHMLDGLLALVNGTKAHAGEAPIPCSPIAPEFNGVVIAGVTEPRLLAIYDGLISHRDYSDDPCVEAMSKLILGSFTVTRQQMAEDRAWYRRRDLDAWRTLGTDCFVYSHQFLRERGCIHLMALNREWGKPAFTERERRVVNLFHEELGRLWHEFPAVPAAALSPRLGQALDLLATGVSEKEIAATMGISRHTAHDYVKILHRRFDVRSRSQLLARLARSRANRAPRLTTESARARSAPQAPRACRSEG